MIFCLSLLPQGLLCATVALPIGHVFWKELVLWRSVYFCVPDAVTSDYSKQCLCLFCSLSSGSLNSCTYQSFNLFTQNVLYKKAWDGLSLLMEGFFICFFEKAFRNEPYVVSVLRMRVSSSLTNAPKQIRLADVFILVISVANIMNSKPEAFLTWRRCDCMILNQKIFRDSVFCFTDICIKFSSWFLTVKSAEAVMHYGSWSVLFPLSSQTSYRFSNVSAREAVWRLHWSSTYASSLIVREFCWCHFGRRLHLMNSCFSASCNSTKFLIPDTSIPYSKQPPFSHAEAVSL